MKNKNHPSETLPIDNSYQTGLPLLSRGVFFMKETNTAFTFFYLSFYVGTRDLTAPERACYLDLLISQCKLFGLPNSLIEIRDYCINIPDEVIISTLEHKFTLCNNRWYSKDNYLIPIMSMGSMHHNWKGGVTPENTKIRASTSYRDWKLSVFRRDGFVCQDCLTLGGELNAHHIKPFAKFKNDRLKIDNGITLCKKCHIKIHTNKNK